MKPLLILVFLVFFVLPAFSQNFVNQKAAYIYSYFAEKYGKEAITIEQSSAGIRYIQVKVAEGVVKGYGKTTSLSWFLFRN